MERERTDLVAADLAAASTTRRGLLRLAAGAIGATALAAIGAEASAARRGKAADARSGGPIGRHGGAAVSRTGRGNAKGKRGTCRPGTGTPRIEIPANGSTVTTPTLAKGSTYRLRASGFVGLANADGSPALGLPAVDADYGFFRQGAPRPNDRVGNLDWGLAIDGKVPAWGAYDAHHDYAIVVAGRGKPLTLELVYATDEFALDGQGTLTLEIECA